jgi:hypothetical protein
MTTSNETEAGPAVKERPILFSGEMVRAIRNNLKTQTRRVVKPMPFIDYPTGFRLQQEYKLDHHPKCSFVQAGMLCDCQAIYEPWKTERIAACLYKVGMRLWVRETFAYVSPDENPRPVEECNIEYRADTNAKYPGGWEAEPDNPEALKWKPSIFMPRWASRITLEVTGVRVERLNSISEEDCIAEGISYWQDNIGPCFGLIPGKATNRTGYAAFGRLWNSINEKRGYGWDKNPFVWCISFKTVQP